MATLSFLENTFEIELDYLYYFSLKGTWSNQPPFRNLLKDSKEFPNRIERQHPLLLLEHKRKWILLVFLSIANFYGTGWPKSKFEICFGYNTENMRFWPYVGKAKMCLGAESLFLFFSWLFTIFSCLFTNFRDKLTPLKRTLALLTWDQKCILSEL